MELADVLAYIIQRGPGRTARELAEAVYGRAEQPLVNEECQRLFRAGKVERRGNGGQPDPYRYFPISN